MKKIFFLVVAFVFWTAGGFAQAHPVLEITSPPSGTTVSPGQTITISVRADPSIYYIALMTQTPLPFAPLVGDRQFSLAIPAKTPVGQYRVSAIGAVHGRQEPISSAPIFLNVEPSESPLSLKPESNSMSLSAVGVTSSISVEGTFSNGSQADLTHSRQTLYTSTDTSVVTVDNQGWVTATGVGQADILITNGTARCSVHVIVERPVCRMRGDGYFYPGKRPNKGNFSLFVTTGPVDIASGTLKYSDAKSGLNFDAFQYTAASVSGRTGTISGVGIVNGTLGYKFTVTVKDKPQDTFSIQIYNSDGSLYYSAGPDRIKEGNVEVICRDQGK